MTMLLTLIVLAAVVNIGGKLNNYNIRNHPLNIRVRRDVSSVKNNKITTDNNESVKSVPNIDIYAVNLMKDAIIDDVSQNLKPDDTGNDDTDQKERDNFSNHPNVDILEINVLKGRIIDDSSQDSKPEDTSDGDTEQSGRGNFSNTSPNQETVLIEEFLVDVPKDETNNLTRGNLLEKLKEIIKNNITEDIYLAEVNVNSVRELLADHDLVLVEDLSTTVQNQRKKHTDEYKPQGNFFEELNELIKKRQSIKDKYTAEVFNINDVKEPSSVEENYNAPENSYTTDNSYDNKDIKADNYNSNSKKTEAFVKILQELINKIKGDEPLEREKRNVPYSGLGNNNNSNFSVQNNYRNTPFRNSNYPYGYNRPGYNGIGISNYSNIDRRPYLNRYNRQNVNLTYPSNFNPITDRVPGYNSYGPINNQVYKPITMKYNINVNGSMPIRYIYNVSGYNYESNYNANNFPYPNHERNYSLQKVHNQSNYYYNNNGYNDNGYNNNHNRSSYKSTNIPNYFYPNYSAYAQHNHNVNYSYIPQNNGYYRSNNFKNTFYNPGFNRNSSFFNYLQSYIPFNGTRDGKNTQNVYNNTPGHNNYNAPGYPTTGYNGYNAPNYIKPGYTAPELNTVTSTPVPSTSETILGSCFLCASVGCPMFFRRIGFACVPDDE